MSTVTLRLGYRAPYDWDAILAFLGRAPSKASSWSRTNRYMRTIEIDGAFGSIEVAPGKNHLDATIRFPKVKALLSIVARLRRLFDLDADVDTIGAHLSGDAALAPLIARRPGLRTPGAWDGFELAVRAILGQQITVIGARKLAVKLVARAGDATSRRCQRRRAAQSQSFPSARASMAQTDLSTLRHAEGAHRGADRRWREAAKDDPKLLEPVGTFDETHRAAAGAAGLRSVDGAVLGVARAARQRRVSGRRRRAAAQSASWRRRASGRRPRRCSRAPRAWRPWRAYAAQHLWTADARAVVAEPLFSRSTVIRRRSAKL